MWPAENCNLGSSQIWGFKGLSSAEELLVLPVVDFEEWLVAPCAFASPLHLYVLNKHQLPHSWPKGCLLQQGGFAPFLQHAASNAFWCARGPVLKMLVKTELGLDVAQGATEADMLLQAVAHVLKISDSEAAAILEASVVDDHSKDEEMEHLSSREAQDCFHTGDIEKVGEYLKGLEAEKQYKADLQAAIFKTGSAAVKRAKKARKAVLTFSSKAQWTPEQVQVFLPPRYNIFRDVFGGRRRAWKVGTKWSSSRSWGVAGSEDSAVQHCIVAAWARHTEVTGEAHNIEGLQGLPSAK